MAGHKAAAFAAAVAVALAILAGGLAPVGASSLPLDYQDGNDSGGDAEFEVTDAELSDDEITEGDSVEVEATVENVGDADGTFEAELHVDGDTVDTQEVDVDAGDSEDVEFTRTFDDAGEYDIAVSDEDAGTLKVSEPADFEVTDASLSDSTITEGESVEVTATVENNGGRAGVFDIELRVDGETEAEKEDVVVSPVGSKQVTFEWTPPGPGEYDIDVNDEDAGTLVVEQSAELAIEDADLSDDEIAEGGSAEVTAEVENEGDREGEFEIRLEADGATVDTTGVTLDGGESRTVEFTGTFDESGKYDLAVAGDGDSEDAGTLTVERPAAFETSDASLGSESVLEGESVAVTATVENVGDREGEHTVPLEVDGSTVDTTDVTLEGGEATTVSFDWTPPGTDDYDVAVDGADAGTLSVDQPATFEVVEAGVDPGTVLEGESVAVTAEVENVGDRGGTYEATLREDGTAVASRNVTVDGGEGETVTFERSYGEAGAYDLAVGDVDAGTVTVERPATRRVDVVGSASSPVLEGESVAVTAEVENVGDRPGSFPVAFTVDGETVENRTVELAEGERETLRFSRTFDDAGEYGLAVAGESAGTVVVEQPATFEVDVEPPERETVLSGQRVRVSGTVENVGDRTGEFTAAFEVDDEAVTSRTVTLDGGEVATIEFVRRFTEPGEYDLAVSGEDAGELRVNQRSDGDGDDDGDGGGTPGDGGPTTVTPGGGDGPDFTVARTETDGQVAAAVEGAAEGTTVLVDVGLGGTASAGESLRVDRLALTLAADRDAFELRVARPAASPDGVPPVPVGEPRWYVGVETDLDPGAVDNVTVSFRLDAAPAEADGEAVHLYRYDDAAGEWTATRASVDDGTYSAPVDGVGPFAVAVFEPGEVAVTDAELGGDWVRTGSRTTAEVVVENPGEIAATRTLAVTVDGEPAATREVSLDPGERAEIEIEFPVREAGSVAVNGTAAGTVETGEEQPDDVDEGGGATGPIDSAVPGFSLRLVALLLAAVALVGRARRG